MGIPAVRSDLDPYDWPLAFVEAAEKNQAIAFSGSVTLGGNGSYVLPNLFFYILLTKDKKINFYYYYGLENDGDFCLVAVGDAKLRMQGSLLEIEGKGYSESNVTLHIDCFGNLQV
ncbi:MAG: hypothetical protein WC786_01235 [Patescibacteria group bacterium]|jgi:hypothetical protein